MKRMDFIVKYGIHDVEYQEQYTGKEMPDREPKNTILDLYYRDANNTGRHISVVVRGRIQKTQLTRLENHLDDGEFMIAHQVGLPTPSFGLLGAFD